MAVRLSIPAGAVIWEMLAGQSVNNNGKNSCETTKATKDPSSHRADGSLGDVDGSYSVEAQTVGAWTHLFQETKCRPRMSGSIRGKKIK